MNDLNAGKVKCLFILGANPAYDAPADFNFTDAIIKAKMRVHSGLYNDETAELCQWHAPAAHLSRGLERCARLRRHRRHRSAAHRAALRRPFGARIDRACFRATKANPVTLWFTITGRASAPKRVRHSKPSGRRSLHDGIIAGTALPTASPFRFTQFVQPGSSQGFQRRMLLLKSCFRPDPSIGDGDYANNGWLQELPKPITRLTWDNAVLISVSMAASMNLTTGRLRNPSICRTRSCRSAFSSCQAMRIIPLRFTLATAAAAPVRSAPAVDSVLT